jgi:hypothetical protein
LWLRLVADDDVAGNNDNDSAALRHIPFRSKKYDA